jgi:hypothetical protein
MSLGVPIRLANGLGNLPDASKWMDNYDYLSALIAGQFSKNAGMELWTAATSFSNPAHGATVADNWTVLKTGTLGATVDVSRESTIIDSGTYSMKLNITGAGSANSIWDIHQAISNYSQFASETVLVGVKVRASTANKVRCKVYDGVTSAYSTYHTGNSAFQLLTALLPVAAVPTQLTMTLEVNPSDFTGAVYVDSIFLYVVPSQISTTARAALAYTPLNAGFLQLVGGSMTGDISMGGNKITDLAAAIANGQALRYEQLVGLYLLLAGGTMAGNIAMGGNKITGAGAASGNGELVRYEQVIGAFLPIGGGTLTGSLAFNPSTGGITGTTTNNAAAAGKVGEYIESLTGSLLNAAASGTPDNLLSISLTAGDWDVTAQARGEIGSATWTNFAISIATVSATPGTPGQTNTHWVFASSSTNPTSIVLTVPAVRVSLASTTTVYLVRSFGYSAGTPVTTGARISARRVR